MTKIRALIKIFCLCLFCLLCSGSYALADTNRVCPPLSEFVAEGVGSRCLLCSIYKTVTDACATVAEISWNAFAEPLQGVVALGGAIYIALYTLKNLGSFSSQDTAAYLSKDKTGVIPIGIKMAVIVLLLQNDGFLYEKLIGPVISTGIVIAGQIGGNPGLSVSPGFDASNVRDLFDNVIEQIRKFNDIIYEIVALGRELLCIAFMPDGIFKWFWGLIPFGAVLYVYGWFILIGVSFYLLDVLFRLAVGCMILPMAIACGMSKYTSGYTKKTWELFVNVFFNFVMLGILMEFSVKMLEAAVAGGVGANTAGSVLNLLDAGEIINESGAKEILENIDSGAFVLTVLCCMVIFQLFMQIEELADQVAGTSTGGMNGLGKQAGVFAGKTALMPAKGLGNAAGGIANTARKEAGKTLKESKAGKAVRKTGRAINNFASKVEGTVFGTGRNANMSMWPKVGKGIKNGVRSWFQ